MQNDELRPDETIAKFNRDYSYSDDLLFVRRLKEKLTTDQVADVLNIIDGICRECLDADAGCHCWNDE